MAALRVVTGALAATAALLLAAPAGAATLAVPTLVAPTANASVQSLPAFAWNAVPGAARYEFALAADAGFNSPALGMGEGQFFTRNTRATVKKTVANGTYWWRVRAIAAGGAVSPWSAPRPLRKSWAIAPTLSRRPRSRGDSSEHSARAEVVVRAARGEVLGHGRERSGARLRRARSGERRDAAGPRTRRARCCSRRAPTTGASRRSTRRGIAASRPSSGSFTWLWPTAIADRPSVTFAPTPKSTTRTSRGTRSRAPRSTSSRSTPPRTSRRARRSAVAGRAGPRSWRPPTRPTETSATTPTTGGFAASTRSAMPAPGTSACRS